MLTSGSGYWILVESRSDEPDMNPARTNIMVIKMVVCL
jgi:hypothetical protein